MSVSERKVIVGMREKQDLVWIYRIYMQWTTPESKTNEPKKGANENQIEMMLVLLLQTIRVAANWKCRWITHSKRSTAIYSNRTLTLSWKTSACFHLVPTFPRLSLCGVPPAAAVSASPPFLLIMSRWVVLVAGCLQVFLSSFTCMSHHCPPDCLFIVCQGQGYASGMCYKECNCNAPFGWQISNWSNGKETASFFPITELGPLAAMNPLVKCAFSVLHFPPFLSLACAKEKLHFLTIQL